MITTRYVREHIDEIKRSLEKRKSDYPIDELMSIDAEWRAAKTELQALLTKRNKESLLISSMKKEGRDASEKIQEVGRIKEDIEGLEAAIVTYEDRKTSFFGTCRMYSTSPYLMGRTTAKMLR